MPTYNKSLIINNIQSFNSPLLMAKPKKNSKKGIVLIKKANNLVESRYKFDIWETRFFLSVLTQIRRDDTEFQVYRIWYKDVIKAFGLKSGDSYGSLREGAKGLMGKSVQVNYEADGVKRKAELHLVRKIDYLQEGQKHVENHEYIDVTIEQEMKPLLLQLKNNFTAYDMRNVIKLGVYSVRLYELLKQYESIGWRMMKVDEMKSMFQVEELYKLFGDFYRWVIAPAEKEINDHTDLLILRVEKIKEGRRVVALRFTFRTKTADELNKVRGIPLQNTLFDGLPEPDDERVEEREVKIDLPVSGEPVQTEKDKLFLAFQSVVVGEFGVSPSVFLAELDHYSEEQVNYAIRVTRRSNQEGKIKSLSGFFMDALRKGFTDTKEETAKKKVRQDRQKANEAAIIEQIQNLQDEWAGLVNDKIRALTSAEPGITDQAITAIRENPVLSTYIGQRERSLERLLDVDDFRTDKGLRRWVIKWITEAYPAEFQPIYAEYETKIGALKKALGHPI